ncbi:GNAT family N-acetyltransferase [Saccharomonospora sp. CUA-673]|uniref:GNAT family N-acetyltransferase n=1 Tax=Saccharomonospora sp. CUA-673 TaxID=1904969 RepID=UPI00095F3D38|nr:GNAT family N-acetyltransferase [Saccharomonospora sp. CUA-673]OLT45359.1 GNAT family N-acetyltransferase [Saccharomonospora sp. CUA-673]
MTTSVTDNPDEQRFEIHVDGVRAGFAEYRRRDDVIAFTHTEIDPEYAGQGLAGKLIRGALDDARSAGLAVHPHCPFVRGFIVKNADYLDLVPENQRARFEL